MLKAVAKHFPAPEILRREPKRGQFRPGFSPTPAKILRLPARADLTQRMDKNGSTPVFATSGEVASEHVCLGEIFIVNRIDATDYDFIPNIVFARGNENIGCE